RDPLRPRPVPRPSRRPHRRRSSCRWEPGRRGPELMSTGIEVEPRRVEATPGTPVRLAATVRNDDSEPRAHRVRIVGSDASWSGEARLTRVLAAGEAETLEFDLRLPLGF